MHGLRYCLFLFLLPLFFPVSTLHAQVQAPVRQVVLGHSTVQLDGLWKFHTGDNPAWAQPGFDDSAWGTLDLTPPEHSSDPILGTSGYVPGWTSRGYPGYAGYAWYRLRVNIQNGQSALALKLPDEVDDAYQVYVNGQKVGEFGKFTANGVIAYNAMPQAFPLPAHRSSGPVTIAIRIWMLKQTEQINADAGGLHAPPVLGNAEAIARLLRLNWYTIDHAYEGYFLLMAVLLTALVVACALFWLDRGEPAYLCLGAICVVRMLNSAIVLLTVYTTLLGVTVTGFFIYAVLPPVIDGLFVIFWAVWFRLEDRARIYRLTWSLVLLIMLNEALQIEPLNETIVSVHASVWLAPLSAWLNMLLGLLLLWVAVRGIRKDRSEGWLALPALALPALAELVDQPFSATVFEFLRLKKQFFLFGVGFNIGQLATVLFLLIITVLQVRRFLRGQREREQWKREIEQARQVQQMLIPEALPVVSGLTLESEYRPAQSVGGDFFQIIPDPSDDSVLIVVGDVSGHGLQAALLVSLLVGAIRAESAHHASPLAMLQSLNQRLLGRSSAQATCLALRIAANGAVTLANAGHLPPYLNGKELAMEGAVPLGLLDAPEFSVMQFHLSPGDRLTLLTDGVVEAQNEKKELFSFARINDLMQEERSAAAIADAAQRHGQEDDITVVRLTRTFSSAVSPA